MSASTEYRPEIDGLRAIAILSVVAFHLGASWLPGGFVGVDVFFVISGFLITSIISRQLADGTFHMGNFWLRRARRLLPALGAMLVITTSLGYLVLVGSDFHGLAAQCTSALTFCANIFMYQSIGNYWGADAEDFAVLHCWSLSVEEQFYLLFPPALLLLTKLGSRRMRWMLTVAAIASFALAVFGSRRYPAAAFYFLPTRAWELIVGSLLALHQDQIESRFTSPKTKAFLADTGLCLTVAALFLVRKGPWFPAPAALLPTLGAALLIGFGRDSGFARRILSLGPVVYVGRISYSWYLMHWPVIVMAHQAALENTAVLFTAGLALGIASYHLIEKPTRPMAERRVIPRIVLPVAAIGLAAFCVPHLRSRRAPTHDLPSLWCTADVVQWKPIWAEKPGCIEADLIIDRTNGIRRSIPIPGPVRALVLGDSHVKSLLPALDWVFGELGWNYIAYPASAASPFFIPEGGDARRYGRGDLWPGDTRILLDRHRKACIDRYQPPFVVIAARWWNMREWSRAEFDAGISNLLTILPNSHFLIVSQPPELPFGDEGFQVIRDDIGVLTTLKERPSYSHIRAQFHGWIREYAARNTRLHFLDITSHFMDGDKVRLHEGRKTLYQDDDHLSVEGAIRLTNIVHSTLVDIARKAEVSQQ